MWQVPVVVHPPEPTESPSDQCMHSGVIAPQWLQTTALNRREKGEGLVAQRPMRVADQGSISDAVSMSQWGCSQRGFLGVAGLVLWGAVVDGRLGLA